MLGEGGGSLINDPLMGKSNQDIGYGIEELTEVIGSWICRPRESGVYPVMRR